MVCYKDITGFVYMGETFFEYSILYNVRNIYKITL